MRPSIPLINRFNGRARDVNTATRNAHKRAEACSGEYRPDPAKPSLASSLDGVVVGFISDLTAELKDRSSEPHCSPVRWRVNVLCFASYNDLPRDVIRAAELDWSITCRFEQLFWPRPKKPQCGAKN